ncbi:MAG: hypothetical protein QY321_01505 [Patescibacteria group bacterium]|nr:MAG: hypothetical protein QY321_01505 [Patescibacteria group bacterium]
MAQGQQNPKRNQPPVPVIEGRVVSVNFNNNIIQVVIDAVVKAGRNPIRNQDVAFRMGTSNLGSKPTDQYGLVSFVHDLPESYAGTAVEFNLHLISGGGNFSTVVSLPPLTKKEKVKTKTNLDPNRIELRSHINENSGLAHVDVRVIGQRGESLVRNVNIFFEGQNHVIRTDREGHCIFQIPRFLNAGEDVLLAVTVDGIAKECVIRLLNPDPQAGTWREFWRDAGSFWPFWVFGGLSMIFVIPTVVAIIKLLNFSSVAWALIPATALFPFFFFALSVGIFILRRTAIRTHRYTNTMIRYREKRAASDPHLENLVDEVKSWVKPEQDKSAEVSNTTTSSRSSGATSKKGYDWGGLMKYIKADIIGDIGSNALFALLKKVLPGSK